MLRRATEKCFFWSVPVSSSPTILLSSNTDEGTEQEASATGEGTPDAPVDDGAVTEITAASEPEASPKVEDPAIVALKEEIAKLELEVKSARRQLANINDEADEFTKTGYARKVAEMENMRRARSVRLLGDPMICLSQVHVRLVCLVCLCFFSDFLDAAIDE